MSEDSKFPAIIRLPEIFTDNSKTPISCILIHENSNFPGFELSLKPLEAVVVPISLIHDIIFMAFADLPFIYTNAEPWRL